MSTTYDTDFYLWTQEQAAVLREEMPPGIDWLNLAEEIDSMGARDRRELARRLQRLLTHLLKWQYQPSKRQMGSSWRTTIRTQRRDIAAILTQSPSLRRQVAALVAARYDLAREHAHDQTHLPLTTFPVECPWSTEQILDDTFFPTP